MVQGAPGFSKNLTGFKKLLDMNKHKKIFIPSSSQVYFINAILHAKQYFKSKIKNSFMKTKIVAVMIKCSTLTLIVLLFCFATYIAIADRGGSGRTNKIHFNIVMLTTLKNSIPFNLKTGLSYKGSTVLNHQQIGNSIFYNLLVSYQKGNTIYILPYRQKVLIPSYTLSSGYKLIIRAKK